MQGNGAAGFGWGKLGPGHSHSLGLTISVYAFDSKNSSTLKIPGPLSTSTLQLEEGINKNVFSRLDLALALAQTVFGLSPCHQGDTPQALATRE